MFCSTLDIIVYFHPTLLSARPDRVGPNVSAATGLQNTLELNMKR